MNVLPLSGDSHKNWARNFGLTLANLQNARKNGKNRNCRCHTKSVGLVVNEDRGVEMAMYTVKMKSILQNGSLS